MSAPEIKSNPVNLSAPTPGPTPDLVQQDKDVVSSIKTKPGEEQVGGNVNLRQSDPTPSGDPPQDSQKQTPQQEQAGTGPTSSNFKLGKKLDLVANILEQELEDLSEEHSTKVPFNLNRQIEQLRKLAKESMQEPNSKPSDDKRDPNYEIKRFSMDEWKKREGEETCAIAAYYRSVPSLENIENGKAPATGSKERPQRVVIVSEVLYNELEDITDVTIVTYAPAMLTSPYKLLVRYYPEITERLAQLQTQVALMDQDRRDKSAPEARGSSDIKHHSGSQEAGSSSKESNRCQESLQPEQRTSDTAGASTENPVRISKSIDKSDLESEATAEATKNQDALRLKRTELTTRIDLLRLLIDFIRTELTYYIDLQESIKAAVIEKIAFEDLWYLFQPGEILFSKTQAHDQLCKAYAVTGGLQRKRAMTKEEGMGRSMVDYDGPTVKRDATTLNNMGTGTWSPLTIDHYIMEFDGQIIGPRDGRTQIKHYAGERKITDLSIYPLRFHRHKDVVVKNLVARGKRYFSSYGHKSYSGLTAPLFSQQPPEELRGDVFIDFNDFYRKFPLHKPRLGVLQRTNPDLSEVEEHASSNTWYFSDHEVNQRVAEKFMMSNQYALDPVAFEQFVQAESNLQLFPHRVPAYVFRVRRYVQLNVAIMAEIDKSDEARDNGFEDLVIPESHRNLLIGLVKNKVAESKTKPRPDTVDDISTQIDIVRGKGRGLIILLHGPPGSGKTSTAETLAAYTRRPLYPITCGDLGITPLEVETALTEHTERAQRWGCILLLDEADVFLTRRDWRDTNHNALVSVFLRQLEYYSGILFLTTNRVGVLDEAFKSRIHVSLAYPTIQLQETVDIWQGILNRIERDNETASIKTKFDRNALLSFAKSHYKKHEKSGTAWNGRQIRNAFQLAIALGHHERDKKLAAAGVTAEQAALTGERKWLMVRLTTDNFRNIAKTARDFEDYLHAVRGHDSDIAKHMSLRHDGHTEGRSEASIMAARKDYGRQLLSPTSRRFTRGDRNASFSTSPRERQHSRPGVEQASPSGSRSWRRDQASVEEDSKDEEQEEECDIFEEFPSDED